MDNYNIQVSRKVLWSDSVFVVELDDIDNQEICTFAEKMKTSNEGVFRSNLGGWQFDMQPTLCSAFDEMIYQLNGVANHVVNEIYGYPMEMFVGNSWLNINQSGDRNAFHTHPGCFLAGVYYVEVPEQSSDINFIRDNHHSIQQTLCQFNIEKPNDHDDQFIISNSIRPVSSMALLFPSWFGHEVLRSIHDGNRIVAGINFVSTSSLN